jgi:hypothetical protein
MRLQTRTACLPDSTQEFAFRRDGVFGHAATADAFFDGDTIYFRVPVPGLEDPVDTTRTRFQPCCTPVGLPDSRDFWQDLLRRTRDWASSSGG